MIDREDLEQLTAAQLHERAVDSAKIAGDVDWLWSMLGAFPALHGKLGDLDESGLDVPALVHAVNDAARADRQARESLRPRYIEYLLEHLD